jgi:chlorophyllide a reductase subunit X
MFAALGDNVATAPPQRPTALNQDELLELFDGSETGAGYELVPATDEDMRGKNSKPKVSLEVLYDDV